MQIERHQQRGGCPDAGWLWTLQRLQNWSPTNKPTSENTISLKQNIENIDALQTHCANNGLLQTRVE
jgi:hypothetical protein